MAAQLTNELGGIFRPSRELSRSERSDAAGQLINKARQIGAEIEGFLEHLRRVVEDLNETTEEAIERKAAFDAVTKQSGT